MYIFFSDLLKKIKNLKLQVQMISSFLQMMCLRFSTKIWHFILIEQKKNDCHGQFLFLVGRNWKSLKLQVQISLVFKLQMSQWFVRWFNWCMWDPLQRFPILFNCIKLTVVVAILFFWMANLFFYCETTNTNDFCQVFYKHSSFHHGQAKIMFCKREQYWLLMAFFISIYMHQFSYFHDHVLFEIKILWK
jgi:hypothetical protein